MALPVTKAPMHVPSMDEVVKGLNSIHSQLAFDHVLVHDDTQSLPLFVVLIFTYSRAISYFSNVPLIFTVHWIDHIMYKPEHPHTYYMYTLARARARTQAQTHGHTDTHTNARTHSLSLSLSLSHTHTHTHTHKLQALVYDILPSATTVFSYAIGSVSYTHLTLPTMAVV